MSSTCPRATKGLAIFIDNPQSTYRPGDTIRGCVFRQVPVLVGAEDVKITLQLVGRSNARFVEWSDHTGESQTSYTYSADMFAADDAQQTLHDGSLHIPRTVAGLADDSLESQRYEEEIGKSWPFSIAIPMQTSPSPGQTVAERIMQWGDEEELRRHGFTPTNKDGCLAPCPLPSSSYTQRREYGPGAFLSGYVEYFLQARLVSAHSNNKPIAVAPITIHNDLGPTENSDAAEV